MILACAAVVLSPALSCGQTGSSTFMVELETEDQRLPVRLLPFKVKDKPHFTLSYLSELEGILHFDLDSNGMTVCGASPGLFSIGGEVCGKELSLGFRGSYGNEGRLETLMLSGDLSRDRRAIHQAADALCKALTGIPGIASTRLLYTVRKKALEANRWTSELWECDSDGANSHQLNGARGYCVTPSYLMPGKGCRANTCLYVSYETGQPKIYLAGGGGIGQRLMYQHANQLMPVVSRQRDRLAFISDIRGNADLFVQSFSVEEGLQGHGELAFLTRGGSAQASPTFHPGGRQLAFVSNKDGSPRIYVIGLERLPAKEAKLISRRSRENSAPAWSPDGTKIAYCALTEGVRQIWVYDMESDTETQLTDGPQHKENPSWAPNSRVLVYNTADEGQGELFLLPLAQPRPIQITQGPGQKRFPCWEPRY